MSRNILILVFELLIRLQKRVRALEQRMEDE
jgi:hypothetical protein